MTPEQLSRAQTEHAHQAAFFCALREHQSKFPQLQFMHAIPNGGERNVAVASRLKAEGVKSGVPDVFLPFPSKGFHGLYIEFKRPKSSNKSAGKPSSDQILWANYLISQNYKYILSYDYLTALNETLDYLS